MATAKQATQAAQESKEEAEVVNIVVDDAATVAPRRFFTIPGRDPFDEIDWETRDALIPGKGAPAFEQREVEDPGSSGRRPRRTSSRRSTSAGAWRPPTASGASSR